jgi:hypothetical protein
MELHHDIFGGTECDAGYSGFEGRTDRLVELSVVLSENHIWTYWWCSPPRIGIAAISPGCWIVRRNGASFCNDRCGRVSL